MAHFVEFSRKLRNEKPPPLPYNTIIELDDGKVEAHKTILAANSVFFKNLFEYTKTGKVIRVGGISTEQMNFYMDWAYLNEIPDLSDAGDKITDCFIAANYFDDSELLETLENVVMTTLDTEEMIEFVIHARNWQFVGLEKKLLSKIQSQFYQIIANPTSKSILMNIKEEEMSYIINENLNVEKDKLSKFFEEWKLKQNHGILHDLLIQTRLTFGNQSQNVILAIGSGLFSDPPTFVEAYDICHDTWKQLPNINDPILDGPGWRKSMGIQSLGTKVYIAGGKTVNDGIVFNQISVFDLATNKSSAFTNMSQKRIHFDLAKDTFDNSMKLIGGFSNQGQIDSTFEIVNVTKRQSERMFKSTDNGRPQLRRYKSFRCNQTEYKIHSHASVSIQGIFYVIGGRNQYNDVLPHTEIFNKNTNEWSCGPQMLNPRYKAAAVAHGSTIYALGGFGQDQNVLATKSCEFLDLKCTENPKWRKMPSMIFGRAEFGAAVVNNQIIVCGGTSTKNSFLSTSSVEIFDIETFKWRRLSNMTSPRYGHKLVCISRSEMDDDNADYILKTFTNF